VEDRGKPRLLASVLGGWAGRRADADFSVFYLPSARRGRLLDMGCGAGEAVAALGRLGWDATGIDIHPDAIVHGRQHGLRLHLGDVLSCPFPDATFDVITLSHVIEHVLDPVALCVEIHRLLRPGGLAVIATPNVDSSLHRKYGSFWLGLDPPRHLQLFRRAPLTALVAGAGLEIVRSFTSVRAANIAAAASRTYRRDRPYDLSHPPRGAGRVIAELEQQIQAIELRRRPDSGEEIVLMVTRA
jgi:SAM-dependent methyltransferase